LAVLFDAAAAGRGSRPCAAVTLIGSAREGKIRRIAGPTQYAANATQGRAFSILTSQICYDEVTLPSLLP
jgi:hypothetical protein